MDYETLVCIAYSAVLFGCWFLVLSVLYDDPYILKLASKAFILATLTSCTALFWKPSQGFVLLPAMTLGLAWLVDKTANAELQRQSNQ
ncbi:MAG: hypothetical protein A3E36_02855 [Candidatus Andersenbacteria bacterium RIFCSPHIGHO2_12_FULL_45_11b]|uniref:Uncharacterized protein n=1 Tax=Candidatus Andersenbacteria bacterium RIFCSPHIGHO2_12_FULL_45_11b TaxID=1797282 RepID=A0A1G1XB69_9BACT|nr:MAG: hypothetical protein A3E36_02855 [Candidatus Andersenbacteria bacterium RIFCSPHIGHO2_12_FULL_45_11b]